MDTFTSTVIHHGDGPEYWYRCNDCGMAAPAGYGRLDPPRECARCAAERDAAANYRHFRRAVLQARADRTRMSGDVGL